MISKLQSIRERWQRQNAMPCRFERRESFCLDFFVTFFIKEKSKCNLKTVITQNACTKKQRDMFGGVKFVDKYTYSVDSK